MVLRELSQLSASDVGATLSVTPAWRERFIGLGKQLAVRIAAETSKPTSRPFLLFGRWRDNTLAAEFAKHYPQQAAQRERVPDDFYKGREDDAPCIVPLPPDIAQYAECTNLAEVFEQEWWAGWLEQAWRQAHKRFGQQDFGGILLSSQTWARELARHLMRLGHQKPPDGAPARLFRYQDPRVMQRVWPLLSPWRRKLWLGPVLAWWSPTHPWGPWAPQSLDEDTLPDDLQPEWFPAEAPPTEQIDADTRIHRGALFDAQQWARAHTVPIGNQLWRRYAMEGIATTEQPDGKTMDRLIADGEALSLTGKNLEDFIWYGWLGRWVAPGTAALRSAWQSSEGAHALQQALDALVQQPQARLAALLRTAGTLPRRRTDPASTQTKAQPGATHGL